MRACCSQCHLNTPSTPFLSFISLLSTMCLVQHVTMGRCVVKSIPSLHFIFSDPSDFQGNFREWLSRCAIYCSFTAQEPTSKLTTDVLSGQMWRGGPPTPVLARSSEQPNVFLRSERPYTYEERCLSIFADFGLRWECGCRLGVLNSLPSLISRSPQFIFQRPTRRSCQRGASSHLRVFFGVLNRTGLSLLILYLKVTSVVCWKK